jgi:hypothetical protein
MDENENLEEEFEDEEIYEEEEIDDDDEDIVDLIKSEIRQLMKERSKYRKTSETYMIYTQRISDATAQLRDAEEADLSKEQKISAIRNKNVAIYQTLGAIAGNIAGSTITSLFNQRTVNKVTECENHGGIVNSKAFKFVK